MRDINLLQVSKAEKQVSSLKLYKRRGGIVVLLTVAVLLLVYAGMRTADFYYTRQIEALRQEAPNYAKVTEVKASISEKQALIDNYNSLLKSASASSYFDTGFLFTLRSVMNDNLFLQNVSLTENGTLSISGSAATRLDITYFSYLLKKTGLFLDVSLSVINTDIPSNQQVKAYDFTLTAIVTGGDLGA